MKKIIIWLIKIYQLIPCNSHYMCRYTPTCSEYMLEAVNLYGVKKGLKMGFKRISRCRPGKGFGYDPVNLKENNI